MSDWIGSRKETWYEHLLPQRATDTINQSPLVGALSKYLSSPPPDLNLPAQRDQDWLMQRARGPSWFDRQNPSVQDGMNTLGALANFVGPGARQMLKLKEIGPNMRTAPISPVPADVENFRFNIAPDGTPQLLYPKKLRDHSGIDGRMFRYIDEFINPLPAGQYYRGSLNPKDRDLLLNGQHRGSMNHATQEHEGGMSVAFRPEASGYPHWYLVKGDRIGTGSDGEPLINPRTAQPVSNRMSLDRVQDHYASGVKRRLGELGVPEDEWRVLSTSHYLLRP